MADRREFLSRMILGMMPLAAVARPGTRRQQTPAKGAAPASRDSASQSADTLYNPSGRASAPVGPLDNDPGVIAIERKLRCTCGCTLDVYTCRTTDFSCTYSPAMHRDVVSAVQAGGTAPQVIDAFVARYGETVLMAPAPRGFNLAGYLVPGLTVAATGLVLVAWLLRKRESATASVVPATTASTPDVDAEQLERLRNALDEVDA